MMQGTSTVIRLLAFMLLATFAAAAYFVSRAYSAQNGQAVAILLIEKQKGKTVELEQILKRLEAEWQIAATESENAITQLEQLQGLIENQDKEIEYLLDNLQTVSNQLIAAVAVEDNINQRLVQVEKEKKGAIEVAAGLRDKLKALEKEFETAKDVSPVLVSPKPPPSIVAGLTVKEVQERLKELEAIKKQGAATSVINPPAVPPVVATGVSGTVREVNAEFGFVVLDVGASNGVKPGDLFSVSRAKEPVGRLRVRKLHSGLSVCDVIATETPRTILRGDQVKQLK